MRPRAPDAPRMRAAGGSRRASTGETDHETCRRLAEPGQGRPRREECGA